MDQTVNKEFFDACAAGDFAKVCAKYGTDWGEFIENEDTARLLQSDFKFRRYREGGLENIGIRRLVYGPDYSVRLL